MNITSKVREEILEEALSQKNIPGFFMMDYLPKSINMMKKRGIKVGESQQLRSLLVDFQKRYFILFLLDDSYWAFWEITVENSKYGPQGYATGVWRGYIKKEKL